MEQAALRGNGTWRRAFLTEIAAAESLEKPLFLQKEPFATLPDHKRVGGRGITNSKKAWK